MYVLPDQFTTTNPGGRTFQAPYSFRPPRSSWAQMRSRPRNKNTGEPFLCCWSKTYRLSISRFNLCLYIYFPFQLAFLVWKSMYKHCLESYRLDALRAGFPIFILRYHCPQNHIIPSPTRTSHCRRRCLYVHSLANTIAVPPHLRIMFDNSPSTLCQRILRLEGPVLNWWWY